jgi:hypothetical protein
MFDPAPASAAGESLQGPLSLREVSEGMLVRRLSVRSRDVVFVKGLIEASDGLANVFAERGGDLLIAAPPGRLEELEELLSDLEAELGARLCAPPSSRGPRA